MKNYTEQELKEKYQQLPEEIKEAMFGDDMENAMRKIADKHKIDEDGIYEIESAARMVMFGMIRFKDFAKHISESAGVSGDIAAQIQREIDEGIFAKIRGALSIMSAVEKYKDPEMASHLNALPGRILIQEK
ncbi:MAG TPA: hypothetical protein ENG99_00740 [bacterium]|nr:hypothetical protein [bacterium]